MRRVLDSGYVKLVDHMSNDNSALEDARMSTDKPTGVDIEADDRLRNRLLHDQHTSPWEGMQAKFELQLPMFCLRQIDRHRTIDELGVTIESSDEVPRQFMSRNEFSGRYSEMPDLFYVPLPEVIRSQSKTNKQSGILGGVGYARLLDGHILDINNRSRENYDWLLAQGVAREQARMVLPMNQYTKLRLTGSCLSWLKFLKLRLQPDVQWETRMFAKAIGRELRALWPKTWAAFEEQMLYTVTLSRSDFWSMRMMEVEDMKRHIITLHSKLSVDLLAEEPNESWEVK
jgi:thymidylate synthase (FAD)